MMKRPHRKFQRGTGHACPKNEIPNRTFHRLAISLGGRRPLILYSGSDSAIFDGLGYQKWPDRKNTLFPWDRLAGKDPLRKANQCVVKFSKPAFLFLKLLGYREKDLFNRTGFYLKGESDDRFPAKDMKSNP